MIKFAAAFFSLFLASASANSVMHEMKDVKADSPLGMKLLGQARQLDQNENGEYAYTWVAGYSLKFEGCRTLLVATSFLNVGCIACNSFRSLLTSRFAPRQTTFLSGTMKPMVKRMFVLPRSALCASACAPAISATREAAAPVDTVTTLLT